MRVITTLLLVTVLAAACSKEESNPQSPVTPPSSPYFLRMKDEGKDWAANGVTSALDVGSTLQITGASLNASSMTIILEKPVQVGTYIITDQTMSTITFRKGFNPNSIYTTFTFPGNGIVNITKAGPIEYEGTFEFVGVNPNGVTRDFTNGEFKVKVN